MRTFSRHFGPVFQSLVTMALPLSAAMLACGAGSPGTAPGTQNPDGGTILGSDGGALGDGGIIGQDGPIDRCDQPCACYNPPPAPPRKTVRYTPSCTEDAGNAGDAGDAGVDACAGEPLPQSSTGYDCERWCGSGNGQYVVMCQVHPPDGGNEYVIDCSFDNYPCGRRPEGLGSARMRGGDAVGRYLASSAYLEAASVDAFDILADELSSHRAPTELVTRARAAARDEVRHARQMRRLAARSGCHVAAPQVKRRSARTLERLAVENMVEGCVRETYGALLATWQSRTARDPAVRAAMVAIAKDETVHAELSWDVAQWAQARLDPKGRARIARARRAAVRRLIAELAQEPRPDVARELGLPRAASAQAMARALDARLWSA